MKIKIFIKEQKTNYFKNRKILFVIDVRLFRIHPDWFNCALLSSNFLIRCSTSEKLAYKLISSVVSVYRK